MKAQPPITIRDLYPEMTDEHLAKAAWKLQRYAEILWRIHQRRNGGNPPGAGMPEAANKEVSQS